MSDSTLDAFVFRIFDGLLNITISSPKPLTLIDEAGFLASDENAIDSNSNNIMLIIVMRHIFLAIFLIQIQSDEGCTAIPSRRIVF